MILIKNGTIDTITNGVFVGDIVDVKVIGIDLDKKRVSLSMKM